MALAKMAAQSGQTLEEVRTEIDILLALSEEELLQLAAAQSGQTVEEVRARIESLFTCDASNAATNDTDTNDTATHLGNDLCM